MKLTDLHEQLCSEARALMEAKNHDYTSGSGDPLANFRGSSFLGINPITGIQLRQQDKMMRIRTFVEKGKLNVANESVRDAILDQINYLVLQYAYIEEQQKELNDRIPTHTLPTGNRQVALLPVEGRPGEARVVAGDSRPLYGARSLAEANYECYSSPGDPRSYPGSGGYAVDARANGSGPRPCS